MRFKKSEKALSDHKGQTMVEFALTLALFLAILFGIIEFGRVWFYSNHLNSSVRAATRYGCMLSNYSSTEIRPRIEAYLTQEIEDYLPAEIAESGIDIRRLDSNGNELPLDEARPGDTLEVTVRYNFTVLTGKVIPFFSGTKQLESTASMPFE